MTDRELDVISVLWARGSGTVAEVRAALHDDLAYTTVLTVLRILEGKSRVRHEREGRAHRYYPVVQKQAAQRDAVQRLVRRFYSGVPLQFLADLVGGHEFTRRELRRVRQLLDAEARRITGADPSRARKHCTAADMTAG